MTNGEAVNWLINISADIGKAEHRDLWHYEQALSEIREMLETAQPDVPDTNVGDIISRQAAIDLIERMKPYQLDGEDCQEIIHNMPSAQPVNYGSTNLIDKNEVLDAIHKVIFSIIDTKSPLTVIDKQLLSINKAITTKIKELQSAQPEPCKEEKDD